MDTYELIEYKPFKIKYEPVSFGWFLFFRSARQIQASGGHWLLHSLTYFIRFFILLLPALILDIITSGSLFILVHTVKWLLNISQYIIKKLAKALISTSFGIAGRISIILIIVFIIISIFSNFEAWEQLSNKYFQYLLQLL